MPVSKKAEGSDDSHECVVPPRRQLLYWPGDDVPEFAREIDPRTLRTIVVSVTYTKDGRPTFPKALFEQLTFHHRSRTSSSSSGRGCLAPSGNPGLHLLEYLDYNKLTGEFKPNCDTIDTEEESDTGFAVLITLNVWYKWLLADFVTVTLFFVDVISNCGLIFGLFTDTALAEFLPHARWVFACSYMLMILVAVITATRAAIVEFHSLRSLSKGDLVSNTGHYDETVTLVALVFFMLCGTRKAVRNIVPNLHPWKSIQPFAAFKCNGSRAFLIGYPEKYHYLTTNMMGQEVQLPLRIAIKTSVFMFKTYMLVYLVLYDTLGAWHTVAVSIFFSSGSLAFQWLEAYRFWQNRRRFCHRLKRISLRRISSPDEKIEQDHANRLMKLHFRRQVGEDGKIRKVRRADSRLGEVRHESKICSVCGEVKDSTAITPVPPQPTAENLHDLSGQLAAARQQISELLAESEALRAHCAELQGNLNECRSELEESKKVVPKSQSFAVPEADFHDQEEVQEVVDTSTQTDAWPEAECQRQEDMRACQLREDRIEELEIMVRTLWESQLQQAPGFNGDAAQTRQPSPP